MNLFRDILLLLLSCRKQTKITTTKAEEHSLQRTKNCFVIEQQQQQQQQQRRRQQQQQRQQNGESKQSKCATYFDGECTGWFGKQSQRHDGECRSFPKTIPSSAQQVRTRSGLDADRQQTGTSQTTATSQ